jgi:exonuclease SbcD
LITGSKLSDSERTLSVGGLDELSRELFNNFDYTALGHLHIRQNLGNNIYYSGSLLKYSISEFNNINTINIYNYVDNSVERIFINTLHNYRIINDYFENIITNAANDTNKDDYIHVELKDDKLVYDAYQRLSKYYSNLVSISLPNINRENNDINDIDFKIENKSELDIFKDFYKNLLKKDITDESIEIIANIINEINKEEE